MVTNRSKNYRAFTLSLDLATIDALKKLADDTAGGNVSVYVRKLIKQQMEDFNLRNEQLEKILQGVAA
jgi:predicted DNA-binding protein